MSEILRLSEEKEIQRRKETEKHLRIASHKFHSAKGALEEAESIFIAARDRLERAKKNKEDAKRVFNRAMQAQADYNASQLHKHALH